MQEIQRLAYLALLVCTCLHLFGVHEMDENLVLLYEWFFNNSLKIMRYSGNILNEQFSLN
jgi:hypothetical protein